MTTNPGNHRASWIKKVKVVGEILAAAVASFALICYIFDRPVIALIVALAAAVSVSVWAVYSHQANISIVVITWLAVIVVALIGCVIWLTWPRLMTVEGTIRDTVGNPVRNELVAFFDFHGLRYETKTDSDGHYEFVDVPVGKYGVQVRGSEIEGEAKGILVRRVQQNITVLQVLAEASSTLTPPSTSSPTDTPPPTTTPASTSEPTTVPPTNDSSIATPTSTVTPELLTPTPVPVPQTPTITLTSTPRPTPTVTPIPPSPTTTFTPTVQFLYGPILYEPKQWSVYSVGDEVWFTWERLDLKPDQYYSVRVVLDGGPESAACIHIQTQNPPETTKDPEAFLKLDCPAGGYYWSVVVATKLPEGSEHEWHEDSELNHKNYFGIGMPHPNTPQGGTGGTPPPSGTAIKP